MNDTEPTSSTNNSHDGSASRRNLPRQRASASPESRSNVTSSVAAVPGAGNSSSLPGHQSARMKHGNYHYLNQQVVNSTDNLNIGHTSGDHDPHSSSHSPPSSLSRKKNLSTSDLDPIERKKQTALTKAETKLEKAQRLHQKAQQSVEQEISDFLRVTTLPNANPEGNLGRTSNATFDKRIRTLQDTKKELEKKIASYQTDISRIQAGDIPPNYSSSKDIFSNIRSTAAKVASGSLKHRSVQVHDQPPATSTSTINESFVTHQNELDHHLNPTLTATAPPTSSSATASNNNQSHPTEPAHSSLSSSTSNEIGNSQFYIDTSHEHIYDNEKSNRKHDVNIPADGLTPHDPDRSPTNRRRLTDDSNTEFHDRISNHSNDDRFPGTTTSKRSTSNTTTTAEYQQLLMKIDSMQKMIDRYEVKTNEMQKNIETLVSTYEIQHDQNERLNNELTDLTDLHQIEMAAIKTDLKNLEERLLYKFNDYWNELLEKLDKLDTRTAKVEQTQTHSLETEENTHRIISKLVNILLTVFAIILILLSTIKNLVQSRIHALTLLILVLAWISFHYLPPNYFQTSVLKNFPTMFKRTS